MAPATEAVCGSSAGKRSSKHVKSAWGKGAFKSEVKSFRTEPTESCWFFIFSCFFSKNRAIDTSKRAKHLHKRVESQVSWIPAAGKRERDAAKANSAVRTRSSSLALAKTAMSPDEIPRQTPWWTCSGGLSQAAMYKAIATE